MRISVWLWHNGLIFFFFCLTCRHLISSASPVHPLLNCSFFRWSFVTPTCFFLLLLSSLSPSRMQSNCRRGATVHFSCDEGYELQGSKSISCLRVTDSYVGWSDDRPICRGKDRRRCMCASSLKLVPAWPPVIFSYPSALIAMRSFPTVVGRPAQSIVSPSFVLLNRFSPLRSDWPDIDRLAGILLLPAIWSCRRRAAHQSRLTHFDHFCDRQVSCSGPPVPCAVPRVFFTLAFLPQWPELFKVNLILHFFSLSVGNIIALIDGYLICLFNWSLTY